MAVSDDGEKSTFALEARKAFLYFNPCLRTGDGGALWSVEDDLIDRVLSEPKRFI